MFSLMILGGYSNNSDNIKVDVKDIKTNTETKIDVGDIKADIELK